MSRVRRQNQNPYAETRKVDSEESNLIVHRCGRVVEEQGSGTALSSVSPRLADFADTRGGVLAAGLATIGVFRIDYNQCHNYKISIKSINNRL
jgi:hypothetical protein